MNKIVAHLLIDNGFQISNYKDDFQIFYRYPVWRTVEKKLQDSIDVVEIIAKKKGFKYSTSKTSVLHYAPQKIRRK